MFTPKPCGKVSYFSANKPGQLFAGPQCFLIDNSILFYDVLCDLEIRLKSPEVTSLLGPTLEDIRKDFSDPWRFPLL